MLKQTQIEKLKSNWPANVNDCLYNFKAPIRLFDPLSSWECYLIAANPEDEDVVICVVKSSINYAPELLTWRLSNFLSMYNEHGESLQIDEEYRSKYVEHILKPSN